MTTFNNNYSEEYTTYTPRNQNDKPEKIYINLEYKEDTARSTVTICVEDNLADNSFFNFIKDNMDNINSDPKAASNVLKEVFNHFKINSVRSTSQVKAVPKKRTFKI